MYVLLTAHSTDYAYFVEFLFNELVLSSNVSEAMVFDNFISAQKFQEVLHDQTSFKFSINPIIK